MTGDFRDEFHKAFDEVSGRHQQANDRLHAEYGRQSNSGRLHDKSPLAESPEEFERAPTSDRRQRFTLARFNAVTLSTATAYLVKGLISRGGLTIVWGPPKCGKSFWTFDVAMHVALGMPYRGRRVNHEVVVYLALEGGHGFRARIEAWRRQHGVDDAPFYLITDRIDLVGDHPDLIEAIREQASPTLPCVVIIDTLNRSLAGSESKARTWRARARLFAGGVTLDAELGVSGAG